MFQRRMEDAWTLSKASLREGELGNYHWLQGDIATLEVSVSLMQGQILKGVAPRLMEFLGFKTMEDMEQQLKLVHFPWKNVAWHSEQQYPRVERLTLGVDASLLDVFTFLLHPAVLIAWPYPIHPATDGIVRVRL
jgi:hypothetical protein